MTQNEQFEYKIAHLSPSDADIKSGKLGKQLNDLGSQGWELMFVRAQYWYFKKRKD